MSKQATYYSNMRHPFAPIVRDDALVLILGSFPSVKSRENSFYYGNPRNRFWQVIAAVFEDDVPVSIPEKQALLFRHKIALWDVAAVCDIQGSKDETLEMLKANDIDALIRRTGIRHIFANGQKAAGLYQAKIQRETGIIIQTLPSTSPANAAWSLTRLIDTWSIVRNVICNDDSKT